MGTPSLTMDSAVTAILLASFLASASAQWTPECALQDAFCDPEDAQFDEVALSDPSIDLPTAAGECYDLCFAQKDELVSPCMDFTVIKLGFRPAKCYLLREPCIKNLVDDCIGLGKCVSGPNDCAEPPATCPVVAALGEGFSRWQCVNINADPINPYVDEPPAGTICYQTCPSWEDMNGDSARLVSECGVDGAWSEAQNFDGQLAYPSYPDGASSYPTPDAMEADALPCGCPPLEVKWQYEDPAGFYYDPNTEPAADFICDTPVDTEGLTTYKIETTNTCVLYCDDHYVATAKCQNGEWLGNPEWGFWCYEEPTAIDGGNGGGGDGGDGF